MRVRWSKGARRQLLEIIEYISKERPMVARKLADRLRGMAERLAENPLSGRVVPEFDDPSVRERLVSPYRLIYTVQSDEIFILAVYHGRRLLPGKKDQF